MYFLSNISEECYGCKACINACPKDAISFSVSDDTYAYPYIDVENCIRCRECQRVCPALYNEFNSPELCFAAISKNYSDWEMSSSGGAFKVLAMAANKRCEDLGKNFYLCGCVWDDSFNAIHKLVRVSDNLQIDAFSKSKYVQSDLKQVYREVNATLSDESNFVMFTGSPCQVAALKLFLRGRGQNRLLTVDLICHGAPGQEIFNKYKKELQERQQSKLLQYTFRNKETLENGTTYNRSSCIVFKNGVKRLVTRFTDDYLKLFYTAGYHFRPSCYPCRFKQPDRVGDITIGDAWGIEKIYPNLNPLHGVSLVLVNTTTGREYIPFLREKMDVYSCEYDYAVQNNKPLRLQERNKCQSRIVNTFFSDVLGEEKSFSECAATYLNSIDEHKTKTK